MPIYSMYILLDYQVEFSKISLKQLKIYRNFLRNSGRCRKIMNGEIVDAEF